MLSRAIIPAFARVISALLPQRYWYRAAFVLSGISARFAHAVGYAGTGPRHLTKGIMLNHALACMTRSRRPFPVPWRWVGDAESVIKAARESGRGVVLCSAHIPLVKVALRAMYERGLAPDVAIAAEPEIDGCIAIWGLKERLPALKVGPNVLLRARSELRKAKTLILLVDKAGGHYSPNIFRLAAATGAAVLLFTVELEPDSCLAIRVSAPPYPACSSSAEITGNIRALEWEVKRISGVAVA